MLPTDIIGKKQKIRRKGKTRYASKEYNNPFFPKKRKRRPRSFKTAVNWKIKIIAYLLLALLAGLLWAAFYSPFFVIKKITVSGAGKIDPNSVRELAQGQIKSNYLVLLPQKNLWLFNSRALRDILEEKFAFNTLEIKKKWPNELVINYNEKDYALIWREGGKYYYSDKTGFIIKEIDPAEIKQKNYPMIENRSDKKISSRRTGVGEDVIAYSLSLFKAIKAYENDFKAEEVIIDNELKTVKLKIRGGPEIYFNTSEDINKQIDKLMAVKNEMLSKNFMSKTYIDVRLGNTVYYR